VRPFHSISVVDWFITAPYRRGSGGISSS
jgi:hypothetical protein